MTIGKHSPDRIVCEACANGKQPNVMHTECRSAQQVTLV